MQARDDHCCLAIWARQGARGMHADEACLKEIIAGYLYKSVKAPMGSSKSSMMECLS